MTAREHPPLTEGHSPSSVSRSQALKAGNSSWTVIGYDDLTRDPIVTPRKIFRLLIILSLALIPLVGAVGYYLMETLPPVLYEYWLSDDSGEFTTWQMVLFTIMLAMFLVALAGMWFFKSWARLLYIIMMIATIPFYFLSEAIIMTPWEYLLGDASMIVDGILIAMMLTGPVSDEFS